MTLNLEQELAQCRRMLDDLKQRLASTASSQLSTAEALWLDINEVGVRLSELLTPFPPPDPTPPIDTVDFEVDEDVLVPISTPGVLQKIWQKFKGRPNVVDAHNMVFDHQTNTRSLQLAESRYPPSPAATLNVTVVVKRAMKAPYVPPDVESDKVPWSLSQSGKYLSQSGKYLVARMLSPFSEKKPDFVYELLDMSETVEVFLSEIPPDAPLTPPQQAYRDRQEQLKKEVNTIKKFVERTETKVKELEARTNALQRETDELAQQVASLPMPQDRVPELQLWLKDIETVVQQLPACEQDIQQFETEFEQVLLSLNQLPTWTTT